MTSNQTLLTLGAFVLLSTILVSFYRLLAQSGDTIGEAQQGISEQTLITTYTELAYGLYFDEATIDSNITTAGMGLLKLPSDLGPENPPPVGEPDEVDLKTFDDFDDLNNFAIIENSMPGVIGSYKTTFNVYYVNPTNVNQISSTRTFMKRLDMKIWRLSPPSQDTLTASIFMGYFRFD